MRCRLRRCSGLSSFVSLPALLFLIEYYHIVESYIIWPNCLLQQGLASRLCRLCSDQDALPITLAQLGWYALIPIVLCSRPLALKRRYQFNS